MTKGPDEFEQQADYVLRTYYNAAIYERYYGRLSRRFDRRERTLEIIVAVGTTGSSVSGWAVWKYGIGQTLWAIVAAAASCAAIATPILRMRETRDRYDKVWAKYNLMKVELRHLVDEISYDRRKMAGALRSVKTMRQSMRGFVNLDQRVENLDDLAKLDSAVRRQLENDIPESMQARFRRMPPVFPKDWEGFYGYSLDNEDLVLGHGREGGPGDVDWLHNS